MSSTSYQVLKALIQAGSQPLSGSRLAQDLGLSRNAIWKAVKKLEGQGYSIPSQPGSGYQLDQLTQAIDPDLISILTRKNWPKLQIFYQDTVSSTNDQGKAYANNHPDQPALFIAKEQTAGRGRQGRSFYSKLKDGLYFSLVIRPLTPQLDLVTNYTIAVASALAQALNPYLEEEIQIKWVNDLFYQKKKVAGILCEASLDMENQEVASLTIGIGLNIQGQIQGDLQKVAGTLFSEEPPASFNENLVLAEFLNRFASYHQNLSTHDYLPYYQNHLVGLNQGVYYLQNGKEKSGTIRGVNDHGNLIIEKENGQREALTSGEIHFSSQQFS